MLNNIENGILMVNSSILADNNYFVDNRTGIFIEAAYPSFFGSDIINNEFYESNGLLINSLANSTELNIDNNQFLSNSIGIIADGMLDFGIKQNDFFDNQFCTQLENTGSEQLNLVERNAFYGNERGVSVAYENGMEFLTNCFDNTEHNDIQLSQASIFPAQGDDQNSAGNCFSNYYDIGHHKIVTDGGSDFFNYFTLEGITQPDGCKNPDPIVTTDDQGIESFENFGLIESDVETDQSCGSKTNIFGSLDPRYRDCYIPNTSSGRNIMLDALYEAMDDIPNLGAGYSVWKIKWLKAKYKRCIDAILKINSGHLITRDSISEAIDVYRDQEEFRYHIMAYGLMMDMGHYTEAQTYLNSLSPAEGEQTDFVSIQNIYLQYLISQENFTLSSTDRNYIKTIGEAPGLYAGFARAIYYQLTRVRIVKEYGEDRVILPRSNNQTNISEFKVKVFPNPVNGNRLSIELPNSGIDEAAVIHIYDIVGNRINRISFENDSEIDVSNLGAGVYFLQVEQMGITSTVKFVKL